MKCKKIPFLVLGLLSAFQLHAATLAVNSVSALENAIASASSGDIIVLSAGRYALNNTLNIQTSITLQNDPAATSLIALDGNTNKRLIRFSGAAGDTLTIKGIQLENGQSSDGEGGGALLISSGKVVLQAVSFLYNTAVNGNGGAIENHGTLQLQRSTFYGNQVVSASAFGGAISNESGATLKAYYNTLVDNTSQNNVTTYGALYNAGTAYLGGNLLSNTVDCADTPAATSTSAGYNWTSSSCSLFNHILDLANQGSSHLSSLTTAITTQVLKPTSASISIIDKAASPGSTSLDCSGVDALNTSLPINGRCDIGAIEYQQNNTPGNTANGGSNPVTTPGEGFERETENENDDDEFTGSMDLNFLLLLAAVIFFSTIGTIPDTRRTKK